MAFAEDLSAFFNVSEFGVTATLTPLSGTAREVIGIFDAEFIAADAGGQVAFSSSQPIFTCKTSDTSGVRNGSLDIDGDGYKIIELRPDGTGITSMILEKL